MVKCCVDQDLRKKWASELTQINELSGRCIGTLGVAPGTRHPDHAPADPRRLPPHPAAPRDAPLCPAVPRHAPPSTSTDTATPAAGSECSGDSGAGWTRMMGGGARGILGFPPPPRPRPPGNHRRPAALRRPRLWVRPRMPIPWPCGIGAIAKNRRVLHAASAPHAALGIDDRHSGLWTPDSRQTKTPRVQTSTRGAGGEGRER